MKECLACGKTLPRASGKKHREREYCNNACKMRVYRQRKTLTEQSIPVIRSAVAERPFLIKRIEELEQRKLDHYLDKFSVDTLEEWIANQEWLLSYQEEQIAAYQAYLTARGLSPAEIDRIGRGY